MAWCQRGTKLTVVLFVHFCYISMTAFACIVTLASRYPRLTVSIRDSTS